MSNSVPEGWWRSTINDFAKTSSGGTPNTQRPEYWENGSIPWMSSGEVHNKRISRVEQYISESGFKNSSAKLFPAGTILIALAGQGKTRGTVAISEIELTTNQSIAGIVVKDKCVSPDYVFHNLDSRYNELRSASGGSGRAGLNLAIIGEQELLLPPFPEQQKIAAILSSVDDVIEKTRAQIDKLKDLKTGMMQELLTKGIGPDGASHTAFKDSPVGRIPEGWNVLTLGDAFKLTSGGTPNRGQPDYFTSAPDGFPWVKTMDLTGGLLSFTSERITASALENSSCKLLPKGTAMVAMYGGWNQIGRSSVLGIEAATNQAICALVPNGLVSGDFANYWLIAMRERWKAIAASSRKDPNITKQDVSDFLIAVPSMTEQRAIVKKLDLFSSLIISKELQLSSRSKLKKALMQDLLTGKVRVKVS
ncbi:restriction endonuclease subunit S [Pseudomonas abyssi]|uniref:restriction endonuclease subunit S n=1 Tax=Pseudomonas abyssi TaxID=170540 RepID=UPI003C7B3E2F